MIKLYKRKSNLGRRVKDSGGNEFVIDELHSGFAWLRNSRGMQQIDKNDFKIF